MSSSEATRPNGMARRAGVASLIGTTIEWYDFFIYGTASALVFNKLFFPGLSSGLGVLVAFVTLWSGYLARPIGAVFFGHFGDRIGRRATLLTTLLLTGGATTLIGVLPTAASVGVAAPLLLVFLRLIQGFALGGEWGGAVLIATEHAPKGRHALYGAAAQVGAPLGLLLSTGMFALLSGLSEPAFLSWGWRVPFLASALLLVVGLFIRLRVEESPEMRAVQAQKAVAQAPFGDVVRNDWSTVLLAVGTCTIGGSAIMFITTFALSWGTTTLGYARSTLVSLLILISFVSLLAMPTGAALADRLGMRRMTWWTLLGTLVTFPLMFALIATRSVPLAALGMIIAFIPAAAYQGMVAGMLAQSFPARLRYTAISLSYQLCGAVLIGTTPLVAQFLFELTGGVVAVVGLAVVQTTLSLCCALALIRRHAARVQSPQQPSAVPSALPDPT
jgi:MFS family permease